MNSINQESTKVEQDQTAQEIKQNDHLTACANDAVDESGIVTTGFGSNKYLSPSELKEHISFRELLKTDGHQFRGNGPNALCCCPFHPDRNPSLSIFPSDAYAHCFGCGWKGDIFAYEMASHRVDFTEAWVNLNEWLLNGPRAIKKLVIAPKAVLPTAVQVFSQKQRDDRDKYAVRLETDPWIAERICQLRFERNGERWNPQTLRHMAMDGPLGWAGDCVAFMYPTGNKFRRWPGKEFIWEGEGLSLWRRHHMEHANHIYLTEGETDAIALVDTGVEDDPYTAVMAVPGAGNFQAAWADLFRDKKVTLCFDNDKAGEAGAEKTGMLLQPYASEILILPVGRVS